MPANRKPTNVLQLNGAFAHDPKRRRVDPLPNGPIGAAPRQGAMTFAKAWDYLVRCAPDGVLFDRDRVWLELAAALFVEYRNHGIAEMHPAKLSRLTSMLASLGMSPADASRVHANPKPVRGDFDDF